MNVEVNASRIITSSFKIPCLIFIVHFSLPVGFSAGNVAGR